MTDHAERLVGADHLQFKWQARAEAAEAEVARLREALYRIKNQGISSSTATGFEAPALIARAALTPCNPLAVSAWKHIPAESILARAALGEEA